MGRHVSKFTRLSQHDILETCGHKSWKKCKGLFYSKGGAGIENNPHSLRRPVNYLDSDNSNNRKGIFREKGKGEIAALMLQSR